MNDKFMVLQKEALPKDGLLWNIASAFESIGQDFMCYIYAGKDGNPTIDLDVENDGVFISYAFDGYGRTLVSYYMSKKNYHIGE